MSEENNNVVIDEEKKEEVVANEEKNEEVVVNEEKTETVVEEEKNEITECLNCGVTLKPEEEFCSKCGMKKGEKKQILCKKCGTELQLGQKFCPKCGEKNEITFDNVLNSVKKKYNENAKKVNPKKLKKIIILLVVLAVVVFAVIKIWPKIFVSTEELLAQGNYEKAYNSAKDSEKDDILKENIVAYLCNDIIDALKEPSSFELREAWYDTERNAIVIRSGGKNSFGGTVTSYTYFTYDEDEEKFELYCNLSDLDEEETYSFDDTEERIEKILKNAARRVVSEIIKEDEYALSKDSVKNINNLFKQELLESVVLLNDAVGGEKI